MQNSIWLALLAIALFALWVLLGHQSLNNRPPQVAQPLVTRSALPPDFVLELPSGSLVSIAVSEDGQRLAVARNFASQQDGRNVNMTELRMFDLDLRQALWTASYENPNCCGLPVVQMTPDGSLVLGAGKQLHLYSQDGQELWTLNFQDGSEFTLLSAELSADGRYIAATTAHRAYLFSSEGQQLWSAEFVGVPTVALSRDGVYLLIATAKLFELYRTADLHIVRQGELSYEEPAVAAAISDDGSAWAIAGTAGTDSLIVRTFGVEPERQFVLEEVNTPQLSLEGSWLVVEGALGEEAALIKITDGSLQRFLKRSDSAHIALAGDRLALGQGRTIEVRRLSDNTLLWQTQAPAMVVMLRLSGDRLIALGSEKSDAALPNRVWAWTLKG